MRSFRSLSLKLVSSLIKKEFNILSRRFSILKPEGFHALLTNSENALMGCFCFYSHYKSIVLIIL